MSVCNRMFVFLKKNKNKKIQLIQSRTGWVAAALSFYPRPLRNNLTFCSRHRPPAIPYSKNKRWSSSWGKECSFPTAFVFCHCWAHHRAFQRGTQNVFDVVVSPHGLKRVAETKSSLGLLNTQLVTSRGSNSDCTLELNILVWMNQWIWATANKRRCWLVLLPHSKYIYIAYYLACFADCDSDVVALLQWYSW